MIHSDSEWWFLPTKGYIFIDILHFEEVDIYEILETFFIKTDDKKCLVLQFFSCKYGYESMKSMVMVFSSISQLIALNIVDFEKFSFPQQTALK